MKILTTNTKNGVKVDIDFDAVPSRQCNGCTLCCKLLPNVALNKPATKPCLYQRHGKGCTIYARRPLECESWACRWICAPPEETIGLKRPDLVHYCIDPMFDEIKLIQPDGKTQTISVVQVWIDPAFPNAKNDPGLRAYLARMAEEFNVAAILRWNNMKSSILFAPILSEDNQWHEQTSNKMLSPEVGLFSKLPKYLQERLL